MLRCIVFVLSLAVHPAASLAGASDDVRSLFERDMQTLDLARVKLEADRIIDPSVDVEAQLAVINGMAAEVEAMLPPDADAWAKVEVLRRYIYESGPWNGQRAFAYDHDDPYGRDVRNKLLGDYLQDRRGNCITMPFLFIILGQRLGLEMAPALAPLHVLVKFTDDQGVIHNLEATSGAGRARDQHYRDLLPITDQALANGLYLVPLDAEQSLAVIAAVVLDSLMARGTYREAMAVADVLLAHYPEFAYALVKKGTAAFRILDAEFFPRFPEAKDVPLDRRAELTWLQFANETSFTNAEELGWRPRNTRILP